MTKQTDFDIDTLPGRILWLVEHCKEDSDWPEIRYDKDFARICQLPNTNYISDLRSDNIKNPSFKVVWNIIKALEISPIWLAEGKGYAFPDNSILEAEVGKVSIQYIRDELRSNSQQLTHLIKSNQRMIEMIDRLMQSPDYSPNGAD